VTTNTAQGHLRPIVASSLLAIPVLLVWTSLFRGWLFDDSYIAFRFSGNWASGNGLTWNPGEDPVEGFTSFAWVLIGALLQRVLAIPPHTSMVFVGIASWMALMVFVLPALIRMVTSSPSTNEGSRSRLPGTVTLLAMLLNPLLGFTAFHGLETALHMLLLALGVYFALKPFTIGTEAALIVVSITSVMTRPDAVAFILPLWGVLFASSAARNQRPRLSAAFLVFLVALGTYSVVKWWWFGYPFPNTFYMKQGGLLSGLDYVRAYVLILSPLWLFLTFAVGRAGLSSLLRDKTFAALVVPSSVFCLAYVKLDPTLGHGYRFLIPTLPLLALACLRAYTLADTHFDSERLRRRKGPRVFTEACTIYVLAMCSLSAVFGLQTYRYYDGWQLYFGWIEQTLVRAGQDLARAGVLSPQPVLATGDAGAIPYFSKLPTVDTIGLADETVTHDGLTHEYLAKRNPDLLILQDLYLSSASQAGESRAGDCSDVGIDVGGVSWTLDIARYRRAGICNAPERAHSGAGSTFQIVTAPSFTRKYSYVTTLDSREVDRYYIFVRREYAHFEELARILKEGRWKDVPRHLR
jgi:arabinofuranosyltransferase